jgi:hypothetical protein
MGRLSSECLGAPRLISGTSTTRCRRTAGQYNPFGEWNLSARRRHRAHCWVLKDQETDSFGPGVPRTTGWCRHARFWLSRARPYLENCTVDASIFFTNVWRQATKSTWWMPWHQEPMKDVGACDKPREVGNRAVIRGFPNGETRLE